MKLSVVLSFITILFATAATVALCLAVPVTDEPISAVMVLMFRTGFMYIIWALAAIVLIIVWAAYLIRLYIRQKKSKNTEKE